MTQAPYNPCPLHVLWNRWANYSARCRVVELHIIIFMGKWNFNRFTHELVTAEFEQDGPKMKLWEIIMGTSAGSRKRFTLVRACFHSLFPLVHPCWHLSLQAQELIIEKPVSNVTAHYYRFIDEKIVKQLIVLQFFHQ